MFSIVVSSLRVKNSTLRNPIRPHAQPKGVRLIHKSAKSRCTSGGDKPGSNNDLGSLFKFDARKMPIPPKSGSAAASGKKESFDDFFESLMKTNPQSKPSSSALNLDSILSSLNKTVKKDDEAEAAFRTIMKKPTPSAAEQPKRPVSSVADNMIPSLTSEDDAEFLEFLDKYRDQFQAPKSEDSASQLDFANLKQSVTDNPFAGLSAEEVAEKLKEATQKIAESNLPASMRSATSFRTKKEIQEAIEAAEKAEAEELDDALRQMKETDERPIWVTNITESLPDGSKVHSSLLEDYEDQELADASVAAAADANFDDDDPELFQSLLQHDKGINDMEYWSLFPTQVKRWLIYTRTPKGYYDDHGEWQTASLRPRGEDFDEEDDDLLLDKSFMEPQEELDQVEDDILDQVDAEGEPLAQSLFDVEREISTEETDMFADSGESILAKDEDWDYWEAVYHNEQQFLPEDLRGQFRFRIKPSEIEDLHPRLRRLFSFKYATPSEIRQYRAQQYISKWGRHPSDTGNSAVQIAILSQRIGHLTKTLKTNVTDTHNGYRLQTLIRRRKGLMKHLKKHDLKTYYTLLKDLGIRDQVELWTSSRK